MHTPYISRMYKVSLIYICYLGIFFPKMLTIYLHAPHSPLSQEYVNTSNHDTEEKDEDKGPDDNFCNIWWDVHWNTVRKHMFHTKMDLQQISHQSPITGTTLCWASLFWPFWKTGLTGAQWGITAHASLWLPRCSSSARTQSSSHLGTCVQTHLALGLMLCSSQFEILSNASARTPAFALCAGPEMTGPVPIPSLAMQKVPCG
jgi:hypothetical protein